MIDSFDPLCIRFLELNEVFATSLEPSLKPLPFHARICKCRTLKLSQTYSRTLIHLMCGILVWEHFPYFAFRVREQRVVKKWSVFNSNFSNCRVRWRVLLSLVQFRRSARICGPGSHQMLVALHRRIHRTTHHLRNFHLEEARPKSTSALGKSTMNPSLNPLVLCASSQDKKYTYD